MSNILSQPLSIAKVAMAIGYTSNSVNNLCCAGASYINKWCKYKPVIYDSPATLTEAQRKSASYGIKFDDAEITISTTAALAEAMTIAKANADDNGWKYEAPVLGDNWGRLDDFLSPDGTTGYNNLCVSPFALLPQNYNTILSDTLHGIYYLYVNAGSSATAYIVIGEVDTIMPTNNVKLSDLTAMFGDDETDYTERGYGIIIQRGEDYSTSVFTEGSGAPKYPVFNTSNNNFRQNIPLTVSDGETIYIAGAIYNSVLGGYFLIAYKALTLHILPIPSPIQTPSFTYSPDVSNDLLDIYMTMTFSNDAYWITDNRNISAISMIASLKYTYNGQEVSSQVMTNAEVIKSCTSPTGVSWATNWDGNALGNSAVIIDLSSPTAIFKLHCTLLETACNAIPAAATDVYLEIISTLIASSTTYTDRRTISKNILVNLGFFSS